MMTMTNDYISILRKYLSTKADAYGITKIGIFGSVARNEQTEDSDVDVCVEMKKPDLFTMVHIKEEPKNSLVSLLILFDSAKI